MEPHPPQHLPNHPPAFDLATYQALPPAELLRRAAPDPTDPTPPTPAALVFAAIARETDTGATGTASGILDIRPEGFGFLRSPAHQCLPGADDIYVSANQIQRLGLQDGHTIEGLIRRPRPGEGYFAMVRIHRVDGILADARPRTVPFRHTTPVRPSSRLTLGFAGGPKSLDCIDHLAPVGRGHRILIKTPRDDHRDAILRDIATGARHNHRAASILLLLVDQAPETAAEVTRAVAVADPRAEVFTTTFDEPPERHVALLALIDARARRLVESGHDVVLLVDGLTQLVRACNAALPHSGKIISAGLDADALLRPKLLLGHARQIENGASLTIFATLLDDGGINTAIAAEFAGRANVDIVLDEELIRTHIDPPIDVHRTRTRNEDSVLPGDARIAARRLRATLDPMTNADAVRHLLAHPPTR